MVGKNVPFGAYLRERRVIKGFSLRRFAELLNVSPTYLSHVEQGKVESPVTARLAHRAAELLEENPDEFVAMAGRVPEDLPKIIQSQPEQMPELLRAANGLTAEKLKKLVEEAKRMREKGGAP
jgi:HTH-type transcriptional regulator, competence development regulator